MSSVLRCTILGDRTALPNMYRAGYSQADGCPVGRFQLGVIRAESERPVSDGQVSEKHGTGRAASGAGEEGASARSGPALHTRLALHIGVDQGGRKLTPKGRATQQRLLEAARQAFGEYGYERTRVADIVRLAQVSHGNFYRHFKDKDDILLAILLEMHGEIRQETRRGPGANPVPSEDDLIERNIRFFNHYARHRHLLRVAREAAAQGEASSFLDLWLDMRGLFTRRTARWLDMLKERGVLPDSFNAALMAEALGSMTEQMAYVQVGLAKTLPRPEELDELGRVCGSIWYRAIFAGQGEAVLPHMEAHLAPAKSGHGDGEPAR